MEIIFTQLASAMAETVTHPIDVLKTNRQVSGKSLYSVMKQIYNSRGIRGFYPSVAPAILRHSVYTTGRVQLYEKLNVKDSGFITKLLLGSFTGGISQFIASPTDLIKVKMQTGQYNSMIKCFRDIYNTQGITGLYQGWKPNVLRAATVNMGELAFYDQTKQYLLGLGYKNDIKTHLSSGLVSGFFATLCSCPADVLKSRLMSSSSNVGVISTLTNIIRTEGFVPLWYGFFPNWLRLAPWQLTFWVSYEYMRNLHTSR